MDAAPPAERRIAVCVDDFGLHPGVAEAALVLAHQGRISAVSGQVGAPAWRSGAKALRELMACGIDIGLHLDLTQHPCDAALRAPLAGWVLRAAVGAVPAVRLRREIECQLDRFEQVTGRAPAHVDGHQHVHQLPGVREVLLDALAARYAGQRPWLRCTRSAGPRPSPKARLVELLGARGLARLAKGRDFRQNRHLLGVRGFSGDADGYLALLERWLAQSGAGDLLMCHPSTQDVPGDAIARARCVEYEVLRGAAFGALLAAAQVRVVTLGEALAR